MSTTEIALLSSCIGATAGILTQFVANSLRDKTDREKIIFDLIAEERKLAYMILLNQTSYDQSGITIEYYYQIAVIHQNTKEEDTNLERHHQEIKSSNVLHSEYCVLVSDYCKNIYKLILYIGHSKELEKVLLKILSYTGEDVTGIFDNCKTYPKLFDEYSKKQKITSAKLNTYKTYFNEMHQTIQSIKKNK